MHCVIAAPHALHGCLLLCPHSVCRTPVGLGGLEVVVTWDRWLLLLPAAFPPQANASTFGTFPKSTLPWSLPIFDLTGRTAVSASLSLLICILRHFSTYGLQEQSCLRMGITVPEATGMCGSEAARNRSWAGDPTACSLLPVPVVAWGKAAHMGLECDGGPRYLLRVSFLFLEK